VVKVGEDDQETLVLLTQQVLDRDQHILKCDISSTSTGRIRGLDELGLNTFTTLNEKHRDTLLSLNSNGKVIGPTTTGDPLLDTIDNEVLTISSTLSSSSDTSNIGTSIRLTNGETDTLSTSKNLRNNLHGPHVSIHCLDLATVSLPSA